MPHTVLIVMMKMSKDTISGLYVTVRVFAITISNPINKRVDGLSTSAQWPGFML